MTVIYLPEGCKLRKYSATTTNKNSVVRIDVEVSNGSALGWLLDELERTDREQKADEKAKGKAGKKPLALPAPLLKLAYHGGDE